MATDVDDFLMHYGVKGMKWGRRKKQDTSSSSTSSKADPTVDEVKSAKDAAKAEKREARAKAFDGKAAKLNVSIKEIDAELAAVPPGFIHNYKRNNLKEARAILERDRQLAEKSAKAVRDGKLTPTQKKVIVGAAVVTVAAAAIYMGTKVDSGEFNSMKLRGQAFLKGEKSPFRERADFADKNMSADQVYSKVVKGINPHYKTQGGSINCRRTAIAYELRRRGYDVVATPSNFGTGQSESGLINAVTPGKRNLTRTDSIMKMVGNGSGLRGKAAGDTRTNPADTASLSRTTVKTLTDAFSKQPDGARGEIVFNFGSFGHAMAYEIFGGKPVIFDAQKAQKYTVDDASLGKMFAKWGMAGAAEITRLDNIDLDLNFLSRWATHTTK